VDGLGVDQMFVVSSALAMYMDGVDGVDRRGGVGLREIQINMASDFEGAVAYLLSA